MNSVDYNAELDHILLSARDFSEIWVIDHSTTTEEAAGHTGGNSGKGGDLLYRWGNPEAYGRGAPADRELYLQHDARWIESAFPGEGNILVFDNGDHRRGGEYSRVLEIEPPVDGAGEYSIAAGEAFSPDAPAWSYQAPEPADFFSRRLSGANRLPNGNTLICQGGHGRFFEVTPDGQIVWEYVSPVTDRGPLVQGAPIPLRNAEDTTNRVFQAKRYGADYPGLAGRDLTPMGVIELPKPTPTPSPTDTPTPEPTASPTPTTPDVVLGDANCDGAVNSIDAAVILQLSAGLSEGVSCPANADVDSSGDITSLDATLVLQAAAGLLELG